MGQIELLSKLYLYLRLRVCVSLGPEDCWQFSDNLLSGQLLQVSMGHVRAH